MSAARGSRLAAGGWRLAARGWRLSAAAGQGQPIDDVEQLRARHAHLMGAMERPPECPPDWGAIRVVPDLVELWSQAPDRMHDRLLYMREGERWTVSRLAP